MSYLRNISRYQLCCKKLVFSSIAKNYLGSRSSSSALPTGNESCKLGPEKEFKEIYRFPHIRVGHAINNIKWPEILLVGFIFPNTAAAYFGGIIDLELLKAIFVLGGVITGNIYALGSLFDRAVGFMYLSEDSNTLRISYLDFWGARVNKEFPVDDIMPLADCPRSPLDHLYRTIYFYSTDKLKLKLYLKNGKLTDEKNFTRVFGDHTEY